MRGLDGTGRRRGEEEREGGLYLSWDLDPRGERRESASGSTPLDRFPERWERSARTAVPGLSNRTHKLP